MSKLNILYVARSSEVPDKVRRDLYDRLPGGFSLEILSDMDFEEREGRLKRAHILMGFPKGLTDDDLRSMENLRFVQLLTAGYDYFNVELAGELGVPVANNGGANSIAVAEHTVMMILALYKKLERYQKGLREGSWHREAEHPLGMYELTGKTVGIIGLGNIGKALVNLLRGFRVEIFYYDVIRNKKAEGELGVKFTELDELLRRSDIVSIHVPLLESTRNMIGSRELDLMKEKAILINTARGGIVDDEALKERLEDGRLAGAGLDVFFREGETQRGAYRSPLMDLKNVVATPHYAGHTEDTFQRRIEYGYRNIEDFSKGEQKWVVNENSLKKP